MRYALIGLLLGGCAMTPNEIREALPYNLSSQQAPETVGLCMSRNFENVSGTFRAQQRPWRDSGSVEVIGNGQDSAFFVAEIQPISAGANITLWLSRNIIAGQDRMVRTIMEGC